MSRYGATFSVLVFRPSDVPFKRSLGIYEARCDGYEIGVLTFDTANSFVDIKLGRAANLLDGQTLVPWIITALLLLRTELWNIAVLP